MAQFRLQFSASANFLTTSPQVDLIINGQLVQTLNISARTGIDDDDFDFDLSFEGAYPSSVSFRFNDGVDEGPRDVTISNVTVNSHNAHLTAFVVRQAQEVEASVTNALEQE